MTSRQRLIPPRKKERRLPVPCIGSKTPYRFDYMYHRCIFRFLDLPAELRNIIYEYLLKVGKIRSTCYPQILQTSKAVYTEASSLLYTQNYINVEIRANGVYAHGLKCGPYIPSSLCRRWHFTKLAWPDFLRRARFMRLRIPPSPLGFPAMLQNHGESISNTLYSLCLMLHNGNRLRRLCIEVAPDPTSTFESMQSLLYPVRLLPSVAVTVTFDLPWHSSRPHPPFPYSLADLLRSSSSSPYHPLQAGPKTRAQGQKLVNDCITLIAKLTHHPPASPLFENKLLRQRIRKGPRAANSRDTMKREDWPAWRRSFRGAIELLRARLEVLQGALDAKLVDEIYALLMLDIDFARNTPGPKLD